MKKLKLNFSSRGKSEKSTREIIKKSCEAVIIAENFVESVEISILLTNNEEIRALNREFRGKDKPTDVLSFPLGETNPENGFLMLGDIVINAEKAASQALEYGHTLERELAFLTIHSVLHLLGYEHENDDTGEKIMREKQTEILEKMGLDIK